MSKESFTQFVGDFGNYSWVAIFARAGFDAAVSVYSDMVGEKPSGLIPVVSGEHVNNPSGSVIEIEGSTWTVILHRVGAWEDFDAAELAKRLKDRVIVYQAEDTSGAVGCLDIASDGNTLNVQTKEDFANELELHECGSEYAEELGIEQTPPKLDRSVDDYDSYLLDLGIFLTNMSLNDTRTVAVVDDVKTCPVTRVVVVGNPCDG